MKETTILDCGHSPSEHSDITTGYGQDSNGKTSCYDCIAKDELQSMNETGKNTMYLVKRDDGYHVTNWPASLDFKVRSFRTSRHNIGGIRTDVWFKVDGQNWHGYQIGQWTEICHCKRVKS